MKLKTLFIGLGWLAAALVLGSVAGPKAVRAAVATLVEVANTTANPVPTADVSHSAAQSVTLVCPPVGGGFCYSLPPAGGTGNTYTVPAGQNLMITDVEIIGPGGGGNVGLAIQSNLCISICGYQNFTIPNDGATHQFLIPNGIPYPAGFQFIPDGTLGTSATLRGYLTSN